MELILWGKNPAYGGEWIKLCCADEASKRYREARRDQGFKLIELPKGTHPDEIKAAPRGEVIA